ncbi:hypothetical protein B0H16DRAFT_1781115 [Mycena metata]|uniref:F-box domain-containing protein n=1 Tax=Mycena metata TaxID=1033252 RepID=A0AAD7JPE0_9AGAR|nr:hypothetical protein B0H16DRAFT_1781115 [Mycena metata]
MFGGGLDNLDATLCPKPPLRPRGRNTKGLPAMSPHLPDEIVSEILSPALKVSEGKFSDNESQVSPFASPSVSSSAALVVCKAWLRVATPLHQTFDKFIVALYNAKQCRTMRQFPAKPSQRGNATIFGENLTTPEQDHQISPERGLIARSFDLCKYLYYPLDHHTTYWPWPLSHHPTKADLILVNNAETPNNT